MMSQDDKELLELAAKAAGLQVDGLACKAIVQMDDELALLILNDLGGHLIWNPLRSDGDALRLAVKLDIHLRFYRKHVDADADVHGLGVCREDFTAHKEAATRRAIVRAAAEIGQSR